jgi:15-cis-phytoene synthase
MMKIQSFSNTDPSFDSSNAQDTMKACTEMMRDGSKSFFAASRVLPARVRAPATALYAFCRVADDAVDSAPNPQAQAAALIDLQARLSAIYASVPHNHVPDRALSQVVHEYNIPREMLEALLEGFTWDAQSKRYDTLGQLHDYAARVAGTVGAMMTLIMGAKSSSALSRACDLGAAMQLTNIARDVGEDARNNRLYLPQDWLRSEGISPEEFLANPQFSPALGRIIERLLCEADRLYWKAEDGISELPRDCRMAIQSARLVYAEIGEQVRRQGMNSVDSRAVVSTSRKLTLMAMAASKAIDLGWNSSRAQSYGAINHWATLPAAQFLVTAGTQNTDSNQTVTSLSNAAEKQNFYHRTVWVIDLCERLAQKDRAAREQNMQGPIHG